MIRAPEFQCVMENWFSDTCEALCSSVYPPISRTLRDVLTTTKKSARECAPWRAMGNVFDEESGNDAMSLQNGTLRDSRAARRAPGLGSLGLPSWLLPASLGINCLDNLGLIADAAAVMPVYASSSGYRRYLEVLNDGATSFRAHVFRRRLPCSRIHVSRSAYIRPTGCNSCSMAV
jgi:hypothetical protein